MHVVRDPLGSTDLPHGAVATIGNFDGVHRGHRRILETVVAHAKEAGRPSVAITFARRSMSIVPIPAVHRPTAERTHHFRLSRLPVWTAPSSAERPRAASTAMPRSATTRSLPLGMPWRIGVWHASQYTGPIPKMI